MDIELLKSLPGILDAALSADADCRPWPIAPARLAALSLAEPTHARAIEVKAHGTVSGGFAGRDADKALALVGGMEGLIALAIDLETYGNAFVERVRVGKKPVGLRRLPAWSMSRRVGGGYRQRLWDGQQELRRDFAEDQVLMIRQPTAQPGWYGLPTWAAAAGLIDMLEAIAAYNARFFQNHAVPDHIITVSGGTLSDAQKEALRRFFQTDFKGLENARKTLFVALSEGQTLEIKPVAQDNDGRFIELYKAARETLPAAHGVPPRLLGIATPGALGGLNEVAAQMHLFEVFTLRPRRRLLIDALAADFAALGAADVALAPVDLTPPGQDIAALPQMVAAGIMTPDEARAWIDLPVKAEKSLDGALAARLLEALGQVKEA
ncbi:phage portal protein [Tepidimonas taiwanensis]|uniref:phage portal protein n=1 Tax=Tepidimonas taiwanensis TaxID=307486 RepID=UPI0005BA47A9|nr:phage portal protein [Tepidimonas taiwanensis]